MESPHSARRFRTSLILVLIWAITLFIANLPKFWLFRLLPICVGWPGALYACWSLRNYSSEAKSATVAVSIATLLSIARSMLPIQTLYAIEDGTTPEISIPLLVVTLSLTVLRDCATIYAIVHLGRLVSEIAAPVDTEPNESLVDKSKSQFRWLAIAWTIATVWMFAIAVSFARAPVQYAELLNGLPSLLRRIAISGHSIIKLFASWNIVLLTMPLASRWQALGNALQEESESKGNDR